MQFVRSPAGSRGDPMTDDRVREIREILEDSKNVRDPEAFKRLRHVCEHPYVLIDGLRYLLGEVEAREAQNKELVLEIKVRDDLVGEYQGRLARARAVVNAAKKWRESGGLHHLELFGALDAFASELQRSPSDGEEKG
jgi:hypothetical protein